MSAQTIEREEIPNGEFIDEYEVIDLIGVGSFGGVYEVKKKDTNEIYAMKTEDINSKRQLLDFEAQIIKEIDGDYFPKYIDSGTNQKYNINYLIMSYFGASIDEIQDYHDSNLDLKLVYNLALKMLESIKAFHNFGFVHRDIKPNNFLLQQNLKYPIVLVDFNLSAKHINPETNKPFPCIKEKLFVGTKLFASIDVLSDLSCGPKDDLISWFYSFLYLVCGTLPWENENDKEGLICWRKSFNLSDLDYEFPAQFQKIYDYLKKLKYEDTPDYNFIENLFVSGMKEDSVSPDSFDWSSFISEHSNMVQYEEEISKLTLDILNKRNKNKNRNTKENN
ncbi:hypothetical protein M9Y10_035054 [Tritrichomonas musculus]|uniref:non-specific serine/threonine protein kinase n=1 Tax=Tritrichomonas musculus TaxID=1915356 RepID=A0ABR2KHH0_9EUKA